MRDRALQEDRMKSFHEIEEFKKMSCTEAERAKPLSIDELSTQGEGKQINSESACGSSSGTTRQGEFAEQYQRVL